MPDGLSMNLRKELFSLSTKTSNRVRAQFNGDYVFRFVQIVLHEFHQKSSFVTFYRSNPQAQKHFAILRAGTFLTCVAPKRPSFNSLNRLFTVFLSV